MRFKSLEDTVVDSGSVRAPRTSRCDRSEADAPACGNHSDVASFLADERPDEPVLCFSRPRALAQLERFQQGFAGEVTFAVKSAPLDVMIDAMGAGGMRTFDVASPVEMELVRSRLPRAHLNYNNPIRSDAELALALSDFGVRHVTVDDEAGLDQVRRIAGKARDLLVAVRLAPQENNAIHDFRGKFGASPTTATKLLSDVRDAGLKTGISFHPGSQCTAPDAFATLVVLAAEVCRKAGVAPATLNVGGGFPAPYLGSGAPDLDKYFAAIQSACETHFTSRTRVLAEPGRALAATTVSLVTRVKHIRANGDLFLNDGIYGGLQEQTQGAFHLPVRAWRGSRPLTGDTAARRCYGPTCDPLDVLPHPITLPKTIAVGDWIEFGLAGAYTLATATRFNGYGAHRIVRVDEIL